MLITPVKHCGGVVKTAAMCPPPTKKGAHMPKLDPVKVEPLGDRVLVEQYPAESISKGGIVLPDTAKHKPSEGRIVALGTGGAFSVKVGDEILFAAYAGTDILMNNKPYLIMREDDIIARVRP